MDQVRTALRWLKEQHFWVLSVLTILVAVYCWYTAAGALADEYASNESKIKAEFNQQRTLNGKPYHPNDKVNERTEEEIKELASKVEEIWTQLYQRQQDKVLKWPAQLDRPGTPRADSFLAHVSDKSFGDFIGNKFRERYLNYIKNRFSDLPKIIKALEIKEGASGRRGGIASRGEGDLGDDDTVVDLDY
ncbi:MAG: hypothetical protein AAGF31_07215, partial [Planctomycetota bacterium]